jgi:tRNA threonylcarbamoyladenosine modification (KEOPS) complex Cgi121 subunit
LAKAWSVAVPEGTAQRFLEDQVAVAKERRVDLLVLRGDLVFGQDHIRAGLHHARKAIREGTNSSDSLTMETLLYVSGERQLGSAIKKMAVGPSTTDLVVTQLSPGDYPEGDGWSVLPTVRAPADWYALVRFGITEEELATVPQEKWTDLVLERVAAVDITKR